MQLNVFDLFIGSFTRMEYNGVPMISNALKSNVWRTPTDNDRNIVRKWREEGYDRLGSKIYGIQITSQDDKHITICSEFSLAGYIRKPVLRGKAYWTVYGSGDIILDTQMEAREEIPYLPRLGLQIIMPESKALDIPNLYL